MVRLRRCGLGVVVAIACGDETASFDATGATQSSDDGSADTRTSEDPSDSGNDGFTGAIDESSSTEGGGSTSSDGGVDTTGSTGVPPVEALCGDGVVEGDEVCDDHNTADGDACSSDCLPTHAVAWTVTRAGPEGSDDRFRDVVVAGDGTIHAVGSESLTFDDHRLLLVHYSPDGEELGALTWEFEGSDTYGRALALHDSGDLIVLASAFPSIVVARVGIDDAIVWATAYGDASTTPDARARFVWSTEGGIRIALSEHIPLQDAVRVVKFSDDGELVWSVDPVAGPYLDADVTGTALADGGETWALGTIGVGPSPFELVDEVHAWRLSDDGIVLEDRVLDLAMANDVLMLAGGETLVAGQDLQGSPALARLAEDGTTLWTEPIGIMYVTGVLEEVHAGPGGDCVGGSQYLGASARLVGCVSADATPIWRDDGDGDPWSEANAIAFVEGELLAVGGVRHEKDGDLDAWIRRYAPAPR